MEVKSKATSAAKAAPFKDGVVVIAALKALRHPGNMGTGRCEEIVFWGGGLGSHVV